MSASCGHCYRCIGHKRRGGGLTVGMTRMIVCPTCGNKRCPHATDHGYACTGSNEPGQMGSRYGAFIPSEVPEDLGLLLATLLECRPRYLRTSRLGRSADRWLS